MFFMGKINFVISISLVAGTVVVDGCGVCCGSGGGGFCDDGFGGGFCSGFGGSGGGFCAVDTPGVTPDREYGKYGGT